jgi:hypothetical protein
MHKISLIILLGIIAACGSNNTKKTQPTIMEVVNNLMNRIIGDQNLPEKERKTWCPVYSYNAESPLQPSRLFGPVEVALVKY